MQTLVFTHRSQLQMCHWAWVSPAVSVEHREWERASQHASTQTRVTAASNGLFYLPSIFVPGGEFKTSIATLFISRAHNQNTETLRNYTTRDLASAINSQASSTFILKANRLVMPLLLPILCAPVISIAQSLHLHAGCLCPSPAKKHTLPQPTACVCVCVFASFNIPQLESAWGRGNSRNRSRGRQRLLMEHLMKVNSCRFVRQGIAKRQSKRGFDHRLEMGPSMVCHNALSWSNFSWYQIQTTPLCSYTWGYGNTHITGNDEMHDLLLSPQSRPERSVNRFNHARQLFHDRK